MTARAVVATAVLAVFVSACGGESEQGGGRVANASCASGFSWSGGGDGGSSSMDPGRDCVSCHASGEGPNFAIAGTVYQDFSQQDGCYGVPGATIAVTDSAGHVFTRTSNDAGNFYFRGSDLSGLLYPIHASVTVNGMTRSMSSAQSDGNCASCHTATGANGAPGRVAQP